jgi:DNA-binding NarL/FixJ family response regulator
MANSEVRFREALAPAGKVLSVTRVVIVDPQPAVRAGLAALLRGEPGLVPVGAAGSAEEALETVRRTSPDLVLLEPLLGTGDGLQLIRRITGAEAAPRVVAYTEVGDPALEVALRVAGADGLVDKQAPPEELFEALRTVARGRTALPLVTPAALRAAAARVESDDLALLAMLVDRTPTADVADTLRLDPRRMARRVERLLARLRPRAGTPAAA